MIRPLEMLSSGECARFALELVLPSGEYESARVSYIVILYHREAIFSIMGLHDNNNDNFYYFY